MDRFFPTPVPPDLERSLWHAYLNLSYMPLRIFAKERTRRNNRQAHPSAEGQDGMKKGWGREVMIFPLPRTEFRAGKDLALPRARR